ncbi:MAG: hypothetical protein ACRD16_16885 [Thermoanaerobaculia bacterium]
MKLNSAGGSMLVQSAPSPTVYLDQWALMDFARDDSCRNRFTKALLRRNGTLYLSWVHLLEFMKTTSQDTADDVEGFLNGLEHRCAFLQPLPDLVVAEENRLLGIPRERWEAPEVDNEVLKILHGHALQSRSTDPFDFRGFIRLLQSSELSLFPSRFEESMKRTEVLLEIQRHRAEVDSGFKRIINRVPTGPRFPTATRYVATEMMRQLIRDRSAKIDSHDWADLAHSVVAASYADYVVLDRGWVHRVEQVGRRLEKSGVLRHFAVAFSGQRKSLESFWKAFDV